MTKEETSIYYLIDKLKKEPLNFSLKDAIVLTDAIEGKIIPRTIIRKTAIEILDLAEEGIFRSTAAEGILGYLNKKSRAKRQERFWDRIAKDFRKPKNNITVLADGDSWFEHPFLYDIIDHLNRKEDVAVFSLAFGGDWLDNILFQGEYIDMLTVIKPDVFLVSGGGNDLLGDKKIGIFAKGLEDDMAKYEPNIQKTKKYIHTSELPSRFYIDDEDIKDGVKYLTIEFFGFINIMQWQYCYLFSSIRKKYKTMPILTQGYDYPLPDSEILKDTISITYWYQHYLNEFLGSGKWLEVAFRDAQIYNKDIMKKTLKAMIHIFNAMLIETGKQFEHVYHIDNRGMSTPHDWFDEIHVKNHKFLQVSETYYAAMKTALAHKDKPCPENRVFLSKEIWETHNKPTFGEAFKAFWRGTGIKKPWIVGTIIFIIAIILGSLYLFARDTFYITSIILATPLIIYYLYKFINALVLSRHFSKD